jgi:hypothetical protein
MGDAAYRRNWEGSKGEPERAATRIVECNPKACRVVRSESRSKAALGEG